MGFKIECGFCKKDLSKLPTKEMAEHITNSWEKCRGKNFPNG